MSLQDESGEKGMGSSNSALPQTRKLSASSRQNSQTFSTSRLFSSTSDNFSHDSYNSTNNRYSAGGLSPSFKQSKLKHFLQALPSAKQLQTVKQKLVKRWSADSRPGVHSAPLGSDWLQTDLEDADFCGSLMNLSVQHQRGCGSTTATDRRSRTRYREHCKNFREFLSDWSLTDLYHLTIEFDASRALSRLHRLSDFARPTARTIADDLLSLFFDGSLTDTILRIDGSAYEYRLHGSLVAARSSLLRRLLLEAKSKIVDSAPCQQNRKKTVYKLFNINREDFCGLDDEGLRLYFNFLYSGRLDLPEKCGKSACTVFDGIASLAACGSSTHKRLLSEFPCNETEQFGGLLTDLQKLYEIANAETQGEQIMGPDAVLLFVNGSMLSTDVEVTTNMLEQHKYSAFKCHTPILAARSSFFRHLIEKRRLDSRVKSPERCPCKFGQNSPGHLQSCKNLTEIVLDESVIPRQYAPVILNAMYTDKVDLSLVIRGCVSSSSCLSEVQAIASGKCQISPVEEATEIFQIARFLEFEILAQGCENVIAQHINVETLPAIYNWSNESHGSKFIRRHCVNFLCQEFVKIANTATLFDIEESLLIEVLKSEFLQASELEILSAILKWGEHQLVKRIEEREPNILVGTTHSISRKGVRRSDLKDEEMQTVLENLTPLIRMDFMLPVQHALFLNVQSRRLLTSTQSFAVSIDSKPAPKCDLRISSSLNVDGVNFSHFDATSVCKQRRQQHRKLSRQENSKHAPVHHNHAPTLDDRLRSSSTLDDCQYDQTGDWQAVASDKQPSSSDFSRSLANCGAPQATSQAVYAGLCRRQPIANNQQMMTKNVLQSTASEPMKCADDAAMAVPSPYLPPRLFAAYYDAARRELEQRLSARPDQLCALINGLPRPSTPLMTSPSFSLAGDADGTSAVWRESAGDSDCPIPNASLLQNMQRSLDDLLQSALIRKAVACGCAYHKNATLGQARLKIVRDFGLTDSATKFFGDQSIKPNFGPIDYVTPVDIFNFEDQTESLSQSPVFDDEFLANFKKAANHRTNSFSNLPPSSDCPSFAERPNFGENNCSTGQSDLPDLMTSSVAKPMKIPSRREPNESNSVVWSTDASSRLSGLKIDQCPTDIFSTASSCDEKRSNSHVFYEISDDYV